MMNQKISTILIQDNDNHIRMDKSITCETIIETFFLISFGYFIVVKNISKMIKIKKNYT